MFKHNRKYTTMCIILLLCSYYIPDYIKLNNVIINTNQTISDIEENSFIKDINKTHPRILAKEKDFKHIRSNINKDKNLKKWFFEIKERVDKSLQNPVNPYNISDSLRLDVSSTNIIVELSFMYKVTSDDKYAKRAWIELENICNDYSDWNPNHFLDTATLAYGAAIGYDWLYDYLTQEQRNIIKETIINKVLKEAIKLYEKNESWTVNEYNWNIVCNSGIAVASLAIIEKEKDIATKSLQEALNSLQYGLRWFSEDGSIIEGPSYWSYGTQYLVYLLASLESSMGTTYNIMDYSGLEDTPWYPIYITGKQGYFNYGDSSSSIDNGSELLLWFASYLNKSELTWYHKYSLSEGKEASVYDLLWYDSKIYIDSPGSLELDKYYSKSEVVTMRSDWDDNLGIFVGVKGGINGAPHGDLDAGTFVYDALGVRWIHDLGSENYNLPGYWNYKIEGERSTYYRKRAEGHNTIVIDPNKTPDQNVNAKASIISSKINRKKSSSVVIDLEPVYNKYAKKMTRTIEFINNRSNLLIHDEIDLKTPKDIYWQIHTKANCEVLDDGKSVMLRQDSKELYIKLLSDTEGEFKIVDAIPYSTSPKPEGQMLNNEFKKVIFKIQDGYKESLKILITPMK